MGGHTYRGSPAKEERQIQILGECWLGSELGNDAQTRDLEVVLTDHRSIDILANTSGGVGETAEGSRGGILSSDVDPEPNSSILSPLSSEQRIQWAQGQCLGGSRS